MKYDAFYNVRILAVPGAGVSLYQCIDDAIVMSIMEGREVSFIFNGTPIVISGNAIAKSIEQEQFHDARRREVEKRKGENRDDHK